MGILYRYDHIEEGRSNPLILSFRLKIEIPEKLCGQLQEHLSPDSDYCAEDALKLYTGFMRFTTSTVGSIFSKICSIGL